MQSFLHLELIFSLIFIFESKKLKIIIRKKNVEEKESVEETYLIIAGLNAGDEEH